MTMPCYPMGCAAGSQAYGGAPSAFSGARVVVGFDNGNVNNNNANNRALARAVRVARECQGAGKTLFHELYDAYIAARGRGLPIGNLPSQFLANVYLNELDQFVKHVLGVKRYLRYVDDFVLFHHDREQLVAWQAQIERFLADNLWLRLKDDIRLRSLTDGLDFLGYVIYPSHIRVRRRVVAHAREAIGVWGQEHVHGRHVHATPAELRRFRSQVASYGGHFRHASSYRLRAGFHHRYPWLRVAAGARRTHLRDEGKVLSLRIPTRRK